mgnify:CR=1 FL=1|jgi:hypothetical protein
MGNAHVSGKVADSLAILKDLGGHAIALALEYPTASSTGGDTASILTAMLQIVQAFVKIDGRINGR